MSADFVLLYDWGIAVCAVMAAVWAFRMRSRGILALPMMLAFVAFGCLLYALRERAPLWVLVACGVVLFLLLATDAVLRTANRKEGQ